MDRELLLLVERAVQGDQTAFEKICHLKCKDILCICISIMGNVPDGEDAAQEVMLRMQKNISSLRAPAAFLAWMNKLIFSVCSNLKRGYSKEMFLMPLDDAEFIVEEKNPVNLPQSFLESRDKKERIVQLIEQMPSQYRMLILFHYYEGLSYKDIAEIMDVSPSSVKAGLFRARKMLKAKLEKSGIGLNSLFFAPILTKALHQSAMQVKWPMIQRNLSVCGFKNVSAVNSVGGFAAKVGVAVNLKTMAAVCTVAALTAGTVAATYPQSMSAKTVKMRPTQVYSEKSESLSLAQGLFSLHKQSEDIEAETNSSELKSASNSLPDKDNIPDGGFGLVPEVSGSKVQACSSECILQGRVYYDFPQNPTGNIQYGVPGAKLELYLAQKPEHPIKTIYTLYGENQGWYAFSGQPKTKYKVKMTLPSGIRFLNDGVEQKIQTNKPQSQWIFINGKTEFQVAETQSSPQIQHVPVYNTAAIVGSAQFSDKNGRLINKEEHRFLEGGPVVLLDKDKQLVMSTTLDKNGNYIFSNPPVTNSPHYTVEFYPNTPSPFTVVKAAEPLTLQPGVDNTISPAILTDSSAPIITIDFASGICECGHIQPKEIDIKVDDATEIILEWHIENSRYKTVLAGNGQPEQLVLAIQEMLASQNNGDYMLYISAIDIAGNEKQEQVPMAILRSL